MSASPSSPGSAFLQLQSDEVIIPTISDAMRRRQETNILQIPAARGYPLETPIYAPRYGPQAPEDSPLGPSNPVLSPPSFGLPPFQLPVLEIPPENIEWPEIPEFPEIPPPPEFNPPEPPQIPTPPPEGPPDFPPPDTEAPNNPRTPGGGTPQPEPEDPDSRSESSSSSSSPSSSSVVLSPFCGTGVCGAPDTITVDGNGNSESDFIDVEYTYTVDSYSLTRSFGNDLYETRISGSVSATWRVGEGKDPCDDSAPLNNDNLVSSSGQITVTRTILATYRVGANNEIVCPQGCAFEQVFELDPEAASFGTMRWGTQLDFSSSLLVPGASASVDPRWKEVSSTDGCNSLCTSPMASGNFTGDLDDASATTFDSSTPPEEDPDFSCNASGTNINQFEGPDFDQTFTATVSFSGLVEG